MTIEHPSVQARPQRMSCAWRSSDGRGWRPRVAAIFDGGTAGQMLIEVPLLFRGRHAANRFQQAARVEPVDPGERREFDRLEMPPRSLPLNHLRLEEGDD